MIDFYVLLYIDYYGTEQTDIFSKALIFYLSILTSNLNINQLYIKQGNVKLNYILKKECPIIFTIRHPLFIYAFGQSFSCSALPNFSFLADTTKVSVMGVLSFTAIPSLY